MHFPLLAWVCLIVKPMCLWTHVGSVRRGDLMMGLHVIKDPNLNANYGNQLFIRHIHLSGIYVVRCSSKNGYCKDMYLKDIGLYLQNYDNCSKFNSQYNLGNLYYHLMSMKIFTLILRGIHMSSKGGLNPRPYPGSHVNSKVKPLKARIALR